MSEEDIKAEAIRYWWERALESLEAARRELEAGAYSFKVSAAQRRRTVAAFPYSIIRKNSSSSTTRTPSNAIKLAFCMSFDFVSLRSGRAEKRRSC